MKKSFIVLLSVQFILICPLSAYDLQAHIEMTKHAFDQSDLSGYLQTQLGLLKDGLYAPDDRSLPQYVNDGTARGWIAEGSVREDNDSMLESDAAWAGGTPRVFRHFYNPLNGAGLTYGGHQLGEPTPDWALGAPLFQLFSFSWARDDFYSALTDSDRVSRARWLAQTFRALGQVVHLVEDMAQPQHTRNDRHAGKPFPSITGAPSLFESRADQRVVYDDPPVDYLSYPVVYSVGDGQDHDSQTFNAARKFWHTDFGLGLADYSNRGFVSAGTNLTGDLYNIQPNPLFPLPDGQGAFFTEQQIEDADLLGPNAGITGAIYFISTPVTDPYKGVVDTNARSSTLSLFDPDLKQKGESMVFTINRFNVDAAMDFLVPRAVGYSAGLINYFFRGKIDFACDYADPENPCLIKNLGPEKLNGVFELWAEDANGVRSGPVKRWGTNQCDTNGCTVLQGIEVAAGQYTRVEKLDAPDSAARYVLVFRGKMGLEEDAVAGKVINNRFLLMTYSATYRTRGTAGPDAAWEKLNPGPIPFDFHYDSGRENLYGPTQVRPFAAGDAVGDRVFASFGIDDQWRVTPVWMSQDGGFSFTDISNAASFGVLDSITALNDTELLAGFYQLYPKGSDVWYGDGGVAYSPDAGQSWEPRASLASSSMPGPGIMYIGNDTVLAAGVVTPDASWFMQSTDNGMHWQPLKPVVDGVELSCVEPPCSWGWNVMSMAWNHVEGAGSVLLAGGDVGYVAGHDDWSQGVWKSVDGGRTWRKVWTTTIPAAYSQWEPIAVAISPSGEALAIIEGRWVGGCYFFDPVTGLCTDNIWTSISFPKWVWKSLNAGEPDSWVPWSGPEGDIGSGSGSLESGGVIGQDIGVMYLANASGGP